MKTITSGPLVNGVTMAADITSSLDVAGCAVLELGRGSWDYSVQIWTTTATTHTGTLYLDESNDGAHWTTKASQPVAAGAALNIMLERESPSTRYARIRFVRTGGAGLLYAMAHLHA